MRALIGIALLVLVLALIGWISFNTDDERPGVNLETPKIEQDVNNMSESLERAGEAFTNEMREADQPAPTTDPRPNRDGN